MLRIEIVKKPHRKQPDLLAISSQSKEDDITMSDVMMHQVIAFAHLNKVFRILGLPSTLPGQSDGVIHHLAWLEHHPLHLLDHQGRIVQLKLPNLCPE